MRLIKQPGGSVLVADAPNWLDAGGGECKLIGIPPKGIMRRADIGQTWQLGQLYGVLSTGLIFTDHVFQGLKRHMFVDENRNSSEKKLAFSFVPTRDARLTGGHHSYELEFYPAPPKTVFVVYVSPNEMLSEYPQIDGWAEHWVWVEADPALVGAPVDWATRYDRKLWSRN